MIHFDAETHTYTDDDGSIMISVTQVLADAGFYGDVAKFWDEYSRDRGSAVHKAIELHYAGTLDESTVDPVVRPYFDAYLKFADESGFYPAWCEKRMSNHDIMVAGTADLIGPLNGKAAIIDIKSGTPGPATAIQLSGYEYLFGARVQRIALQLKDNGKYSMHTYENRRADRETFLAAVRCYRWKKDNL